MKVPDCHSKTYTFKSSEQVIACRKGVYDSVQKASTAQPKVYYAEEKIRRLENAEACLLSQNGERYNASNTIFVYLIQALVPREGHLVLMGDYNEIIESLYDLTDLLDVKITHVMNENEVEKIMKAEPVNMLISQASSLPDFMCPDLDLLVDLCVNSHTILVADNTLVSPILQNPLRFGADLVIHSDVNWLAGVAGIDLGAICGCRGLIDKVRRVQRVYGGTVPNEQIESLLQGMQTLDLRVQRANKNARDIASKLLIQPHIAKVYYPEFLQSQDYNTWHKYMKNSGNIIAFEFEGDSIRAQKFVDNMRIPFISRQQGVT